MTRSVNTISKLHLVDCRMFMASDPSRAGVTMKLCDSKYSQSVNLKSLLSSATRILAFPGNTSAIFTMAILSADFLKTSRPMSTIAKFLAGGLENGHQHHGLRDHRNGGERDQERRI